MEDDEGERKRVLNAEASDLREFQRLTRDRAYQALFSSSGGSGRFLVADEVGLGKTRVAKGVLAELRRSRSRARKGTVVVYIAANAEIGRQNGRVLRGSDAELDLPKRPTLLPLHSSRVRERGIHVLAFTPMTALDVGRGTGIARERALLLRLLRPIWHCGSGDRVVEVFRGGSHAVNFRRVLKAVEREPLDPQMASQFRKAVAAEPRLRESFRSLMRKYTRIDHRAKNRLIGDLRTLLAKTALKSLQPRLVILDEFQRFRWVVDEADQRGTLSYQLQSNCPSLLLSATPYRMRADSTDHGIADDDLLPLLRYLFADSKKAADARNALANLRWALEAIRGDRSSEGDKSVERAKDARLQAEALLCQVMCRWERPVGGAEATAVREAQLQTADVRAYSEFQTAVDTAAASKVEIRQPETVEYWKSAPFLFNFMRTYKMKDGLREAWEIKSLAATIFPRLRRSKVAHLSWRDVNGYRGLDIPNGRARWLRDTALEQGQWKLLWVPPCAPPYQLQGAYEGLPEEGLTKQLVFSGWTVVPTSVSATLGYEAERLAAPAGEKNSPAMRTRRRSRQPLAFQFSRGKGPTGTPVLGFSYPCATLASVIDPNSLVADAVKDELPPLKFVLDRAERQVAPLLREVGVRRSRRGLSGDARWYWLAPLLLDEESVDVRGFLRNELQRAWRGTKAGRSSKYGGVIASIALQQNIKAALAALDEPAELGPAPRNLPRVMAELAVGGPGPVALRSLSRAVEVSPIGESVEIRAAAARIAWAIRGVLGRPDATFVIQRTTKTEKGRAGDQWRRALRYCCEGGLSAVLDEYLHLVRDDADGSTAEEKAAAIAEHLIDVLNLQPLRVEADAAGPGKSASGGFPKRTMSSRFAAPFGATMTEDAESIHPDTVRRAFNSPFWPWILVTTSVGQEGLDFHRYCHSIVHWNVPVSPVELEQREGRVRRFLGHGVRKNIAADHARRAIASASPWTQMRRDASKAAGGEHARFAPEWVYGSDRVQASVVVPPLSRDEDHFDRVRRRRVYYRLALGQTNPDELVNTMAANLTPERAEELLPVLQLDLSPKPM